MKNQHKSALNMLGISRKEINQDSIASVNAWGDFKKGYMNRKFKGNNEKLGPITPEQNKAEYDREKNEFYYDTDKKKLRLIPTDDGEVETPSRQELNKRRKETRDNTLSKKKSPINLNDPYAGQYEGGAGGGADYFSNAEDFQNLFSSIGDAFSKAYTPENRAKYQEKRVERREKRAKTKFPISSKLAESGSENVSPDYKKFTEKTGKIKKRAVENRTKALLAKKKKDQE
jgi:hypothetical protein